jgi:hypothetical protein
LASFANALGVKKPPVFVIGTDATGDVPHVHAAYRGGKVKGLVLFEWGTGRWTDMVDKFRQLGMPDHLFS